MTPITYTLEVNDMHVHAVIAWDGTRGTLFVSYDDNRSATVRLGLQATFLREDAVRALTSRRALADLREQSTYSYKATARAVANRLALLVERGTLAEGDVRALLGEIGARWGGLRTEHDFETFVACAPLAEHVKLCRRNSDDFEKYVAPALCDVIKASIKAGPPVDPSSILFELMGVLRGILQEHGRPTGERASDVLDGLRSLIDDLHGQADVTLQAGSADAFVTAALERRGVPFAPGFGVALKTRALVEYLAAVEATVVRWQTTAKKWQKFADAHAESAWRDVALHMDFANAPSAALPARQARPRLPPLEPPPGAVKVEKMDETGLFTTVEQPPRWPDDKVLL